MTSQNRKSFFLKLSIVTLIVSLGLLIWTSKLFAGSFFAGCVTMMFNFYSLFSLFEGILGEDKTKINNYLFFLVCKFLALGLAVFVLVKFLHVDPLGFGLGFFLVAISASYATSTAENSSVK